MKENAQKNMIVQGWFLAQPHTGIGVHTQKMIEALAQKMTAQSVCILTPRLNSNWTSKKITQYEVKPWSWIPHLGLQKAVWEGVQVPMYLWKNSHLKGALWSPYPTPLYKAILPKRIQLLAMTAHDTFLWKDPRYQGGLFKKTYHWLCKKAYGAAVLKYSVWQPLEGFF